MPAVQMSEWKRIFEEKRVIPPHSQHSRLASGPAQAFRLLLKQVDGLHAKQSEEGKAGEHQLRVTLFDLEYQHFFGRTWQSEPHRAKSSNQPTRVPFNEVIYFHTPLCLSSVVAVVELVSLSFQSAVGAGFGLLRLFSERPDSGPPHGEGRLNLFHGTPRALLHPMLRDPLQKDEQDVHAVFCEERLRCGWEQRGVDCRGSAAQQLVKVQDLLMW
ncbi:hypothetical protein SRHO_G00323740 [Serrasalmus rhombeus]